jgi:hypothetical protein
MDALALHYPLESQEENDPISNHICRKNPNLRRGCVRAENTPWVEGVFCTIGVPGGRSPNGTVDYLSRRLPHEALESSSQIKGMGSMRTVRTEFLRTTEPERNSYWPDNRHEIAWTAYSPQ